MAILEIIGKTILWIVVIVIVYKIGFSMGQNPEEK